MNSKLIRKINIGIIGCVENGNKSPIDDLLKGLLGTIHEEIKKQNKSGLFDCENNLINLIIAQKVSDGEIAKNLASNQYALKELKMDDRCSIPVEKDENVFVTEFIKTCTIYDEIETAINWVTTQSDIVIVLMEDSCDLNHIILQNLRRQISGAECICIDTANPKNIVFLEQYTTRPYSSEEIESFIKSFCVETADKDKNRGFFLSDVWHFCYQRYIRKYKAEVEIEHVTLKDEFLDNQFDRYDNEAVKIAEKYREAIYFRSILPFLSTIFLAIGFYTRTVFGITYDFQGEINPWYVVSGIGFLVHAFINAYAYLMFRSVDLAKNQKKYLHSRYMAEVLRVAAHFLPYGIPLNKNAIVNKQVRVESSFLLNNVEFKDYNINHNQAIAAVKNVLLLLENQIKYHKRTQNRLELVVKRLKAFGKTVFWIGFVFVVFRGLFQFMMPFIGSALHGQYNGIEWSNFYPTFANMLALFLPAWASYFSSKLALNNFEGLFNHSGDAIIELKKMKKKAKKLLKAKDISLLMLFALSDDVLGTQINEIEGWFAQTEARTIQKL